MDEEKVVLEAETSYEGCNKNSEWINGVWN